MSWVQLDVRAICVFTFTVSAVAAVPVRQPEEIKPNILFLMADQMRADLVSSEYLDLPHINSLGNNGIRFNKAFASVPICPPARAAILTGLKPWNHGILGYGDIPRQYPHPRLELAEALHEFAGYHTAVIGKDHFGWDNLTKQTIGHGYQTRTIFDGIGDCAEEDDYCRWFRQQQRGQNPNIGWPGRDNNCWKGGNYSLDEKYHPTAWVGQNALEWIRMNGTKMSKEKEPWLLKVSFQRPHGPYSPPQRILNQISESNLPPIRLASDDWDLRFKQGECTTTPPDPYGHHCDNWCGDMPEPDMTLGRRAYHAEALFVDEWVGSILAELRAQKLLDSTLVLWTSDHGDCQGDHHLHRKGFPYQCSVAVPMLLQWPSVMPQSQRWKRGQVVDDKVVELRDILPTLLDAAGVPSAVYANRVDGQSMLCFLEPERCRIWRAYLDLEHTIVYNATIHWNALTDGELKYIFHAFFASEQLFNLTADPFELVDLASDPKAAGMLRTWRKRMCAQWREEGRGRAWYDATCTLLARRSGLLYSPHYPGLPSPETHKHAAIPRVEAVSSMLRVSDE